MRPFELAQQCEVDTTKNAGAQPTRMVSAGAVIIVGILVTVHSLIAAVTTRLLRVRLTTNWGPVVFALGIVPVLLVISTLVIGGLGIGPDLGSQSVALFVLVAVPMGLGFAVDYLWMPAPDEVELPAALEE